MTILIVIIFNILVQVNGRNKYINYSLIKITPYDHHQLKTLKKLTNLDNVDIFKYSHGINDTTDLLVPLKYRKYVEKFAKSRGMGVKHVDHYGRNFGYQVAMLSKNDKFKNFKYNSYAAISHHLKQLLKSSDYVKLQNIGKSYEGRVMVLMKISSNHAAGNPIIFLNSGVHAREWAGPAFAMYIADQLVKALQEGQKPKEVKGLDWYILPVANPDGYEFSRSKPNNRLWRKTRSKTFNKTCFGADMNRNFGYKWGVSGASFDPCDYETYAGEKAFSEIETRLIRKVMKEYEKRIKLFIDIHSYGEYFVYPWGYTKKHSPMSKKFRSLAKLYSKAVVKAGGQPFKVMSSGQWYESSGSSDDYAYGVRKIPYAYTLEITKGYEFTYPEDLLHTVLPIYYAGLKAIARKIRKEFVHNG